MWIIDSYSQHLKGNLVKKREKREIKEKAKSSLHKQNLQKLTPS